jgi:hypothetical protein
MTDQKCANKVLASIPQKEYQRLRAQLEPVTREAIRPKGHDRADSPSGWPARHGHRASAPVLAREARYGFMERTDIAALLATCNAQGCDVDLNDVTYYVSHETVMPRDDGRGMPSWQESLFALMERNAAHVTDFYHLPTDSVVEIGRQVSIRRVNRR